MTFSINLDNYMDTVATLAYHNKLEPASIEHWPYFQSQMLVKKLAKLFEEEAERKRLQHQKDERERKNQEAKAKRRSASSSIPRMPKF